MKLCLDLYETITPHTEKGKQAKILNSSKSSHYLTQQLFVKLFAGILSVIHKQLAWLELNPIQLLVALHPLDQRCCSVQVQVLEGA